MFLPRSVSLRIRICRGRTGYTAAGGRKTSTREKSRGETDVRAGYVRSVPRDFRVWSRSKLVGQSLSALCTSSLENVATVRGLHSLSEAMLLLSLALLRLVSSEHFGIPPSRFAVEAVFCRSDRHRNSANESQSARHLPLYYTRKALICQGFFETFFNFAPTFPNFVQINLPRSRFQPHPR